MANRYRIYQVRSNALVRKILFDVPSCSANPDYPWIYPNAQIMSYSSLANYVVNNSNGTITDFSDFILYATNVGLNLDTKLPSYGFSNKIDTNDISVNDRFYVNRWDNSHPYIEVTSKTLNTGQIIINMNYCLPSGAVVYNNVSWVLTTNSAQDNTYTFPWCWYINENSSFQLFSADIGIYTYDNSQIIRTNANPTFNPLSIDNAKIFWGYASIVENNPYEEGGYSEPGGGATHKQNWSENSDIVVPSPMPSETDYGAVACGLITIFTPSKNQLRKLSEVMWGQGFWNFVQNAIQNISDLFVSLAMVPFTVTAGDTVEVTWFSYDVGGQVPIGTGIMLTKAANQWYEFDMGTINLTGQGRGFATDSVLDYSPFSKLGIYLPFIGYQELDIDECRESPINLLYRIDILSGTTVALITINGRTIYQFTGNCLTQLPLTSMDAQTMLSNAVNIGIAAASAGATAAVASAGDAMTAENLAKDNISATAAELQNAQHAASVSNAQGSLTSATANGILGMKPNFKKSGAVSASASLFNVMQPYLFLTTPRQSMPEGYQKVCGFPCNMGGTLGSFSGFTVVEDIRLNGLVATSPEVEEIYQLLKSGVII